MTGQGADLTAVGLSPLPSGEACQVDGLPMINAVGVCVASWLLETSYLAGGRSPLPSAIIARRFPPAGGLPPLRLRMVQLSVAAGRRL